MVQQKILIISLGDLKHAIYTLPLLNVLKRNDHRVEYLISEKGFEVVNKNPIVDRVHLAPIEQWIGKMPYFGIFDDINDVSKKLKKMNYDIALDCERTFRSLFLLGNCGAKRKISYFDATGFSAFGASEIIQNVDSNMHTAKKNLGFAKYLGMDIENPEFFLPEAKYPSKVKMNKFLNFTDEKPLIMLAPDVQAGESAWHPKNWVTLASNIPEKYNIVVVGNNSDNMLATKMSHKNLINVCGKTDFEDIRYLLSLTHIVVSNSQEISAIAWAMNKDKIITISTNMSPDKNNPYNINGEHDYRNLIGELPCQPCNKKVCDNSSLYKCSHTPSVKTVIDEISKLNTKIVS